MRFSWSNKIYQLLLIALALLVVPVPNLSAKELANSETLLEQAEELKSRGHYGKAIPVAERALSIQQKALEGKGPEVAKCLDLIGELQYLAGKYTAAEPLLRRGLAIREDVFGLDHVETAQSYEHLGVLYSLLGQYDQAEEYLLHSLKIREAAYGQDHPKVTETLVELGRLLVYTDKLKEAEEVLHKALGIQEKTLGAEHPDLARTLNSLAWLHIDTDGYEKAEPFSKRALQISEKALGPEHPYVADSLNYLGRLYNSRGEFAKSIAAHKRALAIREKILGPDHPDVALSLNNLALPYCGLEQYETAKALFVRSISIREKVLGPEHPQLLVLLGNTGWVCKVLGDYGEAIEYMNRSLAICEKTYGPDSIKVADTKKDISEIYYFQGNYEQAGALLNEALPIYEKHFPPDHPRIASTISHLAILYHSAGKFAEAEPLYKRAVEICEKHFDKDPEKLGTSLGNLASLYSDIGEYEKAVPMFERSLEILQGALGPEHTQVAYALNNLGELYTNLGSNQKAEELLQRALAIWEKALGPNHPNVAISADNLAMVYEQEGNYEKAEPLYKRALRIREESLGPEHPDVSLTMNNLATLYMFMKEYGKAKNLFEEVLRRKAAVTGTENSSYANTLHNLAAAHRTLNEYEQAERLYRQAIEIWKNTLGPEHQYVSTAYGHLSQLCAAQGDFDRAHDYTLRSMEIDDMLIDQVIGFTSESQKLQFIAANTWTLHYYLNLVKQQYDHDPLKRKTALNAWLKRKGLILEAQKRFQEAVFYTGDSEAAELFQKLNDVRVRLSKLTFSLPEAGTTEDYQRKIAELEDEKERLEARLSRMSRPFSLKRRISGADCNQVAEALPPQTALVEFARIETINLSGSGDKELPARYISFVLHAGDDDRISMVDLGDAEKIDTLVTRCRKDIAESDSDGKASRELYDLVFKPLLGPLASVREIFISPDGALNLIPFEVLQTPGGRFLIEDYAFNYLGAGRDILGFDATSNGSDKCLLMGDPDFDLGLNEKQAVLRDLDIENDQRILLSQRSADLGQVVFSPLLYAKQELEAICEIMGRGRSEIYTGKKALEEILMNSPGPEIVHLATHGFFLKGQNVSAPGSRGWQEVQLPSMAGDEVERIQRKINVENPLLRSGILLAGAKRSLLTGDTGTNDGIVTAEKILGLNLHGTKMMVLSACDTGLGEIRTGEGVFGLRRAFTQAGAKSLVMSLWKVPDRETKELMVRFYRNIKSGKMNRCQALRQAALDQMDIVKKRHGSPKPRYWGAFVFMGQP